MADTKHTQGPWSFYTTPQPNGCPIVGSNQGLMVCMLAHTVNQQEQRAEALANARLIAAAPELLEALQLIVTWNRDHAQDEYGNPDRAESWACVKAARAAIAKATGADHD